MADTTLLCKSNVGEDGPFRELRTGDSPVDGDGNPVGGGGIRTLQYSDLFNDSSIGAEWSVAGTGVITETTEITFDDDDGESSSITRNLLIRPNREIVARMELDANVTQYFQLLVSDGARNYGCEFRHDGANILLAIFNNGLGLQVITPGSLYIRIVQMGGAMWLGYSTEAAAATPPDMDDQAKWTWLDTVTNSIDLRNMNRTVFLNHGKWGGGTAIATCKGIWIY